MEKVTEGVKSAELLGLEVGRPGKRPHVEYSFHACDHDLCLLRIHLKIATRGGGFAFERLAGAATDVRKRRGDLRPDGLIACGCVALADGHHCRCQISRPMVAHAPSENPTTFGGPRSSFAPPTPPFAPPSAGLAPLSADVAQSASESARLSCPRMSRHPRSLFVARVGNRLGDGLVADAERFSDRLVAHAELSEMVGLRCDLLVDRRRKRLQESGLNVDLRDGSNSLRPRPRAGARGPLVPPGRGSRSGLSAPAPQGEARHALAALRGGRARRGARPAGRR